MNITLVSGNEKVDLSGSPFRLLDDIDLSGLSATINTAETGSDGALFLNSKYKTREIELQGMINTYEKNDVWIQEQKNILYRIVNPKNQIKIEIEQNGELYFLEAYPIAFPLFKNGKEDKGSNFQTFLLQFTCTDPYLYKNTEVVTFADVTPRFSFPLSFSNVVMGEKNSSFIRTITNTGMMDAPIYIEMQALQTVENPYFLNVYTQKKIQLNTTLQTGEKIIINTGRKKEISKISSGVKETLFYALDLESDFLQLEQGDNIFRYGAESGEENLTIQVTYTERMAGI